MVVASPPIPPSARPAAPGTPSPKPARSAFRILLSELNPLQYLPVVGTIYRAITGDTIPQAARFAGSLVVSGLTGGPVGLALNLGATALEHALDIDPERLGTRLLAELGIGHGTAVQVGATSLAGSTVPAPPSSAWSRSQLAAYGVSYGESGDVRRGTETGADVLNGLELARLNSRHLALQA